MFTDNDARCTNQLETAKKEHINQMDGFTRTSLSATITRESNLFEENVILFLHCQCSPSPCIQSRIAQHLKYANPNALSMFKAVNKCFK